MKNLSLLVIAGSLVGYFLNPFESNKDVVITTYKKEVAIASPNNTTFNVDVASSTLEWEGSKVNGKHNGTIDIESGNISFDKDIITAGNFVVSMATIKDSDLDEGDGKSMLVQHLSGEDFFDVQKYPQTKFEITDAKKLRSNDANGNNYSVMGNLTIKDVTKNITFPAQINIESDKLSAKADFNIDRTDFGIKYGSGKFFDDLGDHAISDIINFKLNLVAKH